MPRRGSMKPKGRPHPPGSAKLTSSWLCFQFMGERKEALDFATCTDSSFAEILLHRSAEEAEARKTGSPRFKNC